MIFFSCESLVELDLSSFTFPLVKSFNNLFNGCKKLNYINLNNTYERSDLTLSNTFKLNTINIAICINPENNTKINKTIFTLKCPIIDCTLDWKRHQKKNN